MSVGVVIGRFQVPRLHSGHQYLLDYVANKHPNLIVILGCPRTFPTSENPLAFDMRMTMILEKYPHANVFPVFDNPSDVEWSKDVDKILDNTFWGKKKTLYGSRDSFQDHYHGKYEVKSVEAMNEDSGTRIRQLINSVNSTDSFRSGVIYSLTTRPPLLYPVVDVAIVDSKTNRVLMAHKDTDPGGRYRFIGGFIDPSDESIERAAIREIMEETGVEVDRNLTYVGSTLINDWRYKNSLDKIMSSFFVTQYVYGIASAKDDIEAVKWIDYAEVEKVIVDSHKPLADLFKKWTNYIV